MTKPKSGFIAIDGEGVTRSNGNHDYILLASSTGEYIWSDERLKTEDCFKFLLKLAKENKNSIFVGYAINYDINKMLSDLSKNRLKALWESGETTWRNYRIGWVPSKWLSLSKNNIKLRIYDVFGFYQMSFVKALEKWDLKPSHQIEEMKRKRDSFTVEQREEIISYCLDECKCLVALQNNLRDAIEAVDLSLKSWVGAGAIASALMRRESVKWHKKPDKEFPKEIITAVFRSYFGGRVEVFKTGEFSQIFNYDICSAYPAAAMQLPSLRNAVWHSRKEFTLEPYSVWLVEWNIPSKEILMPFPYRYKGNIYYPSNGKGIYHWPEVKRALEIYPEYIRVQKGWVLEEQSNDKPFNFVRDMYEYRKQLKKEGHAGEKVIKLGLNALYGKLAQGRGFRGSEPPFQSFYWAGRITSTTRAKILDIAAAYKESLVMIATDGIFFDNPVDVVTSEELGGWEHKLMHDVFVAQPGVYCATVNGDYIKKSRGFFARELDFSKIRAGYKKKGPHYIQKYNVERFVGLGTALMLKEFDRWGKWPKSKRKLVLYPNRKFIDNKWEPGEVVRHHPAAMPNDLISAIYVPKGGQLEYAQEALEYVQAMEQPLKDL